MIKIKDDCRAKLSPCPNRPNCVSTLASDKRHRIAPFHLKQAPSLAWPLVRDVIGQTMNRCEIVEETEKYIRVECRSRFLKFTDDLELCLDIQGNRIDVRSASRLGYSDFGANRKRVEKLRKELHARKIIQ